MPKDVRVLLVDDNEEARGALAKRLRRCPQLELVGIAAGPEEAACLLPAALPDIVLLDLHGHDGRGTAACRKLQELTDAPVVVLAAFMTPELWAPARDAGAADYLLKHIDTNRLERELRRLAERHREAVRSASGGVL